MDGSKEREDYLGRERLISFTEDVLYQSELKKKLVQGMILMGSLSDDQLRDAEAKSHFFKNLGDIDVVNQALTKIYFDLKVGDLWWLHTMEFFCEGRNRELTLRCPLYGRSLPHFRITEEWISHDPIHRTFRGVFMSMPPTGSRWKTFVQNLQERLNSVRDNLGGEYLKRWWNLELKDIDIRVSSAGEGLDCLWKCNLQNSQRFFKVSVCTHPGTEARRPARLGLKRVGRKVSNFPDQFIRKDVCCF
jgi:hypothetical protein